MAVALLLVIVVMREAGQPGWYQTFFGGQEDNWVELAPKSATPAMAGSDAQPSSQTVQPGVDKAPAEAPITADAGPPNGSALPPSSDELKEAPQPSWAEAKLWVSSMDVELQRQWVETLACIKTAWEESSGKQGMTSPWRGLNASQLEQSLNLLYAIDQLTESADKDAVLDSLGELKVHAQSGAFPDTLWSEIRSWGETSLDALDAAALLRVSDGTFWTGKDSDAFYLQLWRGRDLATEGAMTTGTVPLLQQPQIYQGQLIRLAGTIQLAEEAKAQDNRVAIDSYWKLWVIPSDGGIRPTLLITADLPDPLRRCINEDGTWNRRTDPANADGRIEAVGRFIKRLPYRSSIGADLAPVLIGRISGMPGKGKPPGRSADAARAAEEQGATGFDMKFIGVLLAIAAGIALAFGLMYRTSVDGRRSRQMRQATLTHAEPNFDDLSAPGRERSKTFGDHDDLDSQNTE